ncbi:MAG: carbohydrate kinase family protein [Thermoplasmata archaeon]
MAPTRVPWEERAGSIDLTVAGHVNVDHFLHVAGLPAPDRTVPIARQETHLGGTATNLARSAAAWGVRAGIISRVGHDFPATFTAVLEREHIDLAGIERVADATSSCCYIVEDGKGGQMTLIDQGPMGSARTAPVPLEVIAASRWLHLATGDPDYLLRIAREARRTGVPVSVDPAQEIHYRWDARRFHRLVGAAEILFGNTAEIDRASELLGTARRTELLAHVPLVIETRGGDGAVAYHRAGIERVRAVRPRPLRQVTGAGDAFRGGFFAAWLAGQPLGHCLIAGTRSAARWMSTGSRAPLVDRPDPGRSP